jgi:hypothetical protein
MCWQLPAITPVLTSRGVRKPGSAMSVAEISVMRSAESAGISVKLD